MVNLFAFVKKQKARKHPHKHSITVWIRKQVLLLHGLSKQPVVCFCFALRFPYVAFGCRISCHWVCVGFSVFFHRYSVDISKEFRFISSPSTWVCPVFPHSQSRAGVLADLPPNVCCAQCVSSGSMWCHRTPPLPVFSLSLSHQLSLSNSSILWGDKPSPHHYCVSHQTSPPNISIHRCLHQSPSHWVPNGDFFSFYFIIPSSVISRHSAVRKNLPSLPFIYLSLLPSLFILILKSPTVWTVRAPQCGFSSFWTGPFILSTSLISFFVF